MKQINYLALHGRQARTNSNTYRFIAYKLGKRVVCSAECVSGPTYGKTILDFIHDRSETTRCLKVGINHNLFV